MSTSSIPDFSKSGHSKRSGEDRARIHNTGFIPHSSLKAAGHTYQTYKQYCESVSGSGVFMTPGSGMEKNPDP
jgi:hypothetical protein